MREACRRKNYCNSLIVINVTRRNAGRIIICRCENAGYTLFGILFPKTPISTFDLVMLHRIKRHLCSRCYAFRLPTVYTLCTISIHLYDVMNLKTYRKLLTDRQFRFFSTNPLKIEIFPARRVIDVLLSRRHKRENVLSLLQITQNVTVLAYFAYIH